MDPYMYRNIEFDCWNDIRKEAKRYNVYVNDYNFKVNLGDIRIIVQHTYARFMSTHPTFHTFISISTLTTLYTTFYVQSLVLSLLVSLPCCLFSRWAPSARWNWSTNRRCTRATFNSSPKTRPTASSLWRRLARS